mgnify:CR=1 FL=1
MREKHFFTNSTTFDIGYLFDKPANSSSRNHDALKKEDNKDTLNKEVLSK